MTVGRPDDAIAAGFEAHRGRLVAVARRLLGSQTDAEDAVQEAWLRLARQAPGTIDNLGGWLTTVVGRVCIDVLRARGVRPAPARDGDLADLVVTPDPGALPEDDALLAEAVGLALLVVLDALSPAERLAFVLHDMFAMPFDEIGPIVGRSTDATKMLASRARRKVQRIERPVGERQAQRAVVDAFLAAAREGDLEGLLRVLDPGVTLRAVTRRGVVTMAGGAEVASLAVRGGAAAKATPAPVLVNGEPGLVLWDAKGRPQAMMICTVVDGRIVEILALNDPRRLATMDLPGRPG